MEIAQYDCLQEKNINIGTDSTYLRTCPLLGDQNLTMLNIHLYYHQYDDILQHVLITKII